MKTVIAFLFAIVLSGCAIIAPTASSNVTDRDFMIQCGFADAGSGVFLQIQGKCAVTAVKLQNSWAVEMWLYGEKDTTIYRSNPIEVVFATQKFYATHRCYDWNPEERIARGN